MAELTIATASPSELQHGVSLRDAFQVWLRVASLSFGGPVLWKFEKGKRCSVKWIRNTPTPTRQWHDLKVRIAGPKVAAYLDGKLYLEHALPEPVSGRIGLWS